MSNEQSNEQAALSTYLVISRDGVIGTELVSEECIILCNCTTSVLHHDKHLALASVTQSKQNITGEYKRFRANFITLSFRQPYIESL